MGTATVDLKECMRARSTTLQAPLSTQGVISITVSWEMHEEYASTPNRNPHPHPHPHP